MSSENSRDCETQYRKLVARCADKADYRRVMEWIFDSERKPAVNAFTEGPERQLAYAVEWLINTLEKPDCSGETEYIRPHMLLESTEQCPRCGFVRVRFADDK